MAGREENRIFVGGLSAHTTERQLDDAFRRYGKILESVVSFFLFSTSPCVVLFWITHVSGLGQLTLASANPRDKFHRPLAWGPN